MPSTEQRVKHLQNKIRDWTDPISVLMGGSVDIKERLTKNEQKVEVVQAQLQQLQRTSQELLQKLLDRKVI